MTGRPAYALIDTSVFIAREASRPLDVERLPVDQAISVVTLGELHAGVHGASDTDTRARRLATLALAFDVDTLPIGAEVAASWGLLRAHVGELRRRVNVNDLWIAATAVAHDLPLVTQDADFDALEGLGGLVVVRV